MERKNIKRAEKKYRNGKFNDKSNNTIIKDYIGFYSKNIFKKHIVCTILFLILYIVILISTLTQNNINVDSVIVPSFFDSLIKQKVLSSFVIILAGIVPYFYMSVLGFAFVSDIVQSIVIYYVASSSVPGLIANMFGGILLIFAYAFSISIGIYYCYLSSKRFKYTQGRGFSFLDVKRSIAKIRKNEKKVNEYDKEEEEKRKKLEEYNVKIDYKNMVISFIFIFVILFISTIFLR